MGLSTFHKFGDFGPAFRIDLVTGISHVDEGRNEADIRRPQPTEQKAFARNVGFKVVKDKWQRFIDCLCYLAFIGRESEKYGLAPTLRFLQ